ncbi:MAG: DPP IV N-terminal domain-containing protein [Bacteroidetes bacterium]|nr:DPP IV N-terminal domain-containing protein [Bacteroidota bacterium]
MKKYALLVCLLWMGSLSFAQLKTFTAEESVLLERNLLPARVAQLDWVPGTERFAHVGQVDGEWQLLAGDVSSAKQEVLCTLKDFNKALEAVGFASKPAFPGIKLLGTTSFRFLNEGAVCTYDWVAKKVTKVTTFNVDGENMDLSAQHGVAYTVAQNLFISLPGKPDIAVTNEANAGIRNGESAHRNEFGIVKGTFWSPNGDQIAFYRMDQTMVTDYPMYNFATKPAGYDLVKYPMAGAKSHHVTVGVYNSTNGKTTFLKTTGDPEHYLTNITWSPDQKSIYMAELNRDQSKMALNRYNAETGEFEKTLFEDADDKWIEPKHGPQFIPGRSDEFIWQTQRDGMNHLYLYKTDGTLVGQITKSADWMVTEVLGFDAKSKMVYVTVTGNFGADRLPMAFDLKTMQGTPLATESGVHTSILSPSGAHFIDIYTSVNVPNLTTIRETKKATIVKELLNAPDPLKEYAVSKPKLFTIKAADGKTDLTCRLIQPVNFNEDDVYPVIVYVYNGPGVQLVTNSWGAGAPLWMQYAAQKGYYVFTVDGRGSANRGKAFEQAIFRDLGTVEIADQLKGVDYLKSLINVAKDRMVVHGWSYGGFMTSSLMLRAPGVFKAGVAGGPVIDWGMYEIMYTERYMDTPQTNKEGYDKSLVTKYIKDLKGKLMLIHGTSDDVVVWQHSLDFVEKSVTNGVQMDYFVYPSHAHNVRGKDRAHLMRKVLDYLMENNK